MTRRAGGAVLAVALLAGTQLLLAGEPPASIDTGRIDTAFAADTRTASPGCAAGIVHAGRLVWSKGYGYASVEHKVPIDSGTVFDLGSTSKQITAALVALLVNEGKLSLDDTVGQFAPEMPEPTRRVTLRQLLNHTSGLRDYTDILSLAGRREADVTTREEALAAMRRQRGVNFEAGSAYRYCNSGYFLLSVIVEQVRRTRLRGIAQKTIFAPLGMEHTTFFDDHTLMVPHRATGYSWRPGSTPSVEMSDWEQVGDGGVQSSIEDMARWAALFDDDAPNSPLPAAWLRETLETPGRLKDGTTLRYSLGLGLDTYRGLRVIEHGGAWAGYRAMLMRIPDWRVTTLVLCNYAQADTRSLAATLADAALEAFPPASSRHGAPRVEPAPPVHARAPLPAAGDVETYYSLALGEVATLRRVQGDLAIDEGDRSTPLIQNGKATWTTADGRVTLRFAEDRQSLTWADEGESDPRPATYRRAPAKVPVSVDRLRKIGGTYQSDEIGPAWEVTFSGSKGRVAIAGGESFDLEPLDTDLFTSDAGLIAVERDAHGQPSALVVTSRGVVGLRVPRLPAPAAGGR
ncbi:MAG TPA: serine hydrolase domain-containing protein [Dongiaceae bacterium]|nr:serine hydrolase domain-containing protein [Dongiaceae bacterium]